MFFESNYQKSNRIKRIKFKVSKGAYEIAQQILNSDATLKRQKLALELCDELCDLAGIDICNVKITEVKQAHKKSRGRVVYKQYGYYKPGEKYIYINNRTAVRGQILASKTFLNTLLHEWMHHYDSCKLKLESIHSTGFYLRLKSLEDVLRS